MARTRTTKKLAQRIDLNYFKRPTPLKRAKLWLSLLLPLLALVWIAWRGFSGDHRVYSSGRMSEAHAVLEKECAACHVQQAGAFSAKAENAACVACHDGPIHHANETKALPCSACHSEHRGRVNIHAAGNQNCAECHADLKVNGRATVFAPHIHSFEDGHPQFAALRESVRDPGTIKLNHAIHMKPIRQGPLGPIVQLECGDCHRPAAYRYKAAWRFHPPVSHLQSYGPTVVVPESPLPDPDGWMRTSDVRGLSPDPPLSSRANMALPLYELTCSACHSLQFDKRFTDEAPHDQPSVIHVFIVNKFAEYIAAHPAELHESRDPDRDITEKPIPPRIRVLTPVEWVAKHTAEAEELLWRKTCKQCHTLVRGPQGSWPESARANPRFIGWLPNVAPPKFTDRWMPHAKFDHSTHTGFTCESCHEKALTSTESSDILLPGIVICQTCHAPGPDHAESRCFECHTYHDWSRRKEVKPTFALPALRTGKGGN